MVDWSTVIPEVESQPDMTQVPVTRSDENTKQKINLWTKTDFTPKRIDKSQLNHRDKSFTAIGPIESLPEDKVRNQAIIKNLNESSFLLRSGYDKRLPFEMEVLSFYRKDNGKIHYYLPWAKFADDTIKDPVVKYPTLGAYEYGAYYNPNFKNLKPPVRAIIARLVHQLLGKDLRSPVGMVICYDKYGIDDLDRMKYPYTTLGITLSIAKDAGIPVFNVRRQENVRRMVEYISVTF